MVLSLQHVYFRWLCVRVSKYDEFEPITELQRWSDRVVSLWKMKLDVKHLVDHWVLIGVFLYVCPVWEPPGLLCSYAAAQLWRTTFRCEEAIVLKYFSRYMMKHFTSFSSSVSRFPRQTRLDSRRVQVEDENVQVAEGIAILLKEVSTCGLFLSPLLEQELENVNKNRNMSTTCQIKTILCFPILSSLLWNNKANHINGIIYNLSLFGFQNT